LPEHGAAGIVESMSVSARRSWVAAAAAMAVGCSSFSPADAPDAAPDAGRAGDAGADASGFVPGETEMCITGSIVGRTLGFVAMTGGKVNVHAPETALDDAATLARGKNGWFPDKNCTSGAQEEPLAYCQKFWEATTYVAPYSASTTLKPYYAAGCLPDAPEEGNTFQKQFSCCAP